MYDLPPALDSSTLTPALKLFAVCSLGRRGLIIRVIRSGVRVAACTRGKAWARCTPIRVCDTRPMGTKDNTPFRIHPAEFNVLRRAAARNGIVINAGDIKSLEDHDEAVFMGLDQKTADDLESFLETGTYPGMEENIEARERESLELAAAEARSEGAPVVDELAARRAARRVP